MPFKIRVPVPLFDRFPPPYGAEPSMIRPITVVESSDVTDNVLEPIKKVPLPAIEPTAIVVLAALMAKTPPAFTVNFPWSPGWELPRLTLLPLFTVMLAVPLEELL